MNRDQFKDRIENFHGHYLHPDDLRIGLYVHLDLGWMDHPFTFSNFKIKDEEQIRKIRALNLEKIRYDPMRSDIVPDFPKTIQTNWTPAAAPPQPATQPDLLQRSDRFKKLNEIIIESEQTFARNASTAREAVRNLIAHPEHSKKAAEVLVNEMVNSVITESDIVLHAISGNNSSQVNFIHPINVSVLALMLAKSLDMKEEEAVMLGVASIFHDVGKEEALQNKSFVDLHCEIGARIALRAGMADRVSKIILQHHEYMDGSGFPLHLRDEKIDPLARILVLVNYYDNLCNPPNPAEAMTPYEALSQMYASQSQKFDSTLLKLLIKSLGVYPPGSIVQLTNDVYGIVLTVNPNKPLLPLVMIYVPEVARETPVVIDLGEEKNLTIRKCLRAAQLPQEVFDYLRPSKRVSYYFLRKEDALGPELDPESTDTSAETGQDLKLRRA